MMPRLLHLEIPESELKLVPPFSKSRLLNRCANCMNVVQAQA